MMHTEEIIRHAIAEDLGSGDHTSLATIPSTAVGKAVLLVKQDGILAGVPYAMEVFRQIDPRLVTEVFITDGSPIRKGDEVFMVHGPSRSIVAGERLALNILQRLSGIATFTASLVEMIAPYPAKLLDTRKTTPLLREMEKYAVRMGGGQNHRFGLFDMIMIKDNHIDFAGGIVPAIQRVQDYLAEHQLHLPVEVEVRSFQELEEVLAYGKVNRIMLDNFAPEGLAIAIERIGRRFETEASGGIDAGTIVDYAASGVDFISIGALTHQIRSLDLSLKVR
jgi:nicotinate-nucleotide pyrophosphorylase (carboxylating)